MAKKIILITAALFGVLLLGLIFQFINNDLGDTSDIYLEPELDKTLLQESSAQIEAIKAGEVSFSTSEGVVFQVPGKREFGYEKRVSNDQGMFQILNPWVKLYSQDNIIRITAQKGLVPINNDTQSLSSGGPDQGILEGDVSIEVFRKPENIKFDEFEFNPEFKELAVKLGKTKFEREFSRIIGEGQVRVISPQFLATGQDLVMQYDQINKKLQLLEISQMQKLVVTIKKDKKKSSAQNQNSNSQSDVQNDQTITGPADFMTYYLNLSNNITVQTQQESFTADQLSIMADIASGNDFIEESKKKSDRSNDPADQLIANNSIDNENYRIITMTCNGPLTITSPDKPYHAPDGLPRLELIASGKPVEIYRNGMQSLKADKIVYSRNTDNGNHTIKLISQDKYRDLYLAQDISQTVSAASEISYDFNNNIATLAGPGVINSTINDDNKTKIEFSDTINVKFENAPVTEQEKIDIPLNTTRKVEWIECIGTVVATLKEGRFSSQKARINFDVSADNSSSNDQPDKTPAVDNMIMSGNVTMTDGLSNFNCDKLILRFKQQNGLSEPVSLWAGGNVIAENNDYIIESSDRILINFGKQRDSKQTDLKKSASGSETAFSDMDQMFTNLNPVYVIAEGANGGVTFKNKSKNFAVKGSSIEGKLPDIKTVSPEPALAVANSSNSLSQDGIWKITGQPAIVQLSENRTVSGSEIELDQASGFCRIPGSGSLNLVTSGEFSGSSMPVNIKWNDGVIYNIANNILALRQATFEIDRLTDDNILQNTRLFAANVDIEISAITDPLNNSARHELKNFRAYGPGLKLITDQIDLEHNDLLDQSQLTAGQILFESLPKPILTASGGGWLEHIAICQPDKIKLPDEDNMPAENNSSSFEPGYYFLQFTRSLVLDLSANDISFNDPVGMHYMPLAASAAPEVLINTDNTLPPGAARLYCDRLRLVNSTQEKQALLNNFSAQHNSDSLSAALGSGALGYACASGNIFMEHTAADGSEHYFAASELLFDRERKVFSIIGSEQEPVRYDQMLFEYLNYDLDTASYNGKTYGQTAISGQ